MLAFVNPDGTVSVIVANVTDTEEMMSIEIGGTESYIDSATSLFPYSKLEEIISSFGFLFNNLYMRML